MYIDILSLYYEFIEPSDVTKTRDNHYVPQWYQKGFMEERDNQLCHLTYRKVVLKNGDIKNISSKKWQTATQRFYEIDLYSTFLKQK